MLSTNPLFYAKLLIPTVYTGPAKPVYTVYARSALAEETGEIRGDGLVSGATSSWENTGKFGSECEARKYGLIGLD